MERENLVNEDITAPSVMVLREGNSVQQMRRDEALWEAQEKGVDLVQVSNSKDDYPTCMLVDYGKFMYHRKKKGKKPQRTVTKEVKFRPTTQENDYQVKMRRIREFLSKKNRVKVTISFRGRESSHSDLGMRLADRIAEEIGARSRPVLENNTITMVLE